MKQSLKGSKYKSTINYRSLIALVKIKQSINQLKLGYHLMGGLFTLERKNFSKNPQRNTHTKEPKSPMKMLDNGNRVWKMAA